jgi:hypothetical protein
VRLRLAGRDGDSAPGIRLEGAAWEDDEAAAAGSAGVNGKFALSVISGLNPLSHEVPQAKGFPGT